MKFKRIILLCSWVLISHVMSLDLDSNSYEIRSNYSNQCIEVENNSSELGTKLIQVPCNGKEEQKFSFHSIGNGYFKIESFTGHKLQVASNSKSNGVNIVQDTLGNDIRVTKSNNGYKFRIKKSGLFISANLSDTDIVQFPKNTLDNQVWTIGEKKMYSCLDILESGKSTGDGTYKITQNDDTKLDVFCDMTTDGGGWTVLLDFDQNHIFKNASYASSLEYIKDNDGFYIMNKVPYSSLNDSQRKERIAQSNVLFNTNFNYSEVYLDIKSNDEKNFGTYGTFSIKTPTTTIYNISTHYSLGWWNNNVYDEDFVTKRKLVYYNRVFINGMKTHEGESYDKIERIDIPLSNEKLTLNHFQWELDAAYYGVFYVKKLMLR